MRLLELVYTFPAVMYVPKSISPFEQELRKIARRGVVLVSALARGCPTEDE